jgi:hypothetical protein
MFEVFYLYGVAKPTFHTYISCRFIGIITPFSLLVNPFWKNISNKKMPPIEGGIFA